MVFIHRFQVIDFLQDRYGLDCGIAASVADFAHACGAYGIPGACQRRVQFMEGYGYTVN